MGTLSIAHWLIVIVLMAIYGVPMALILSRAGYSRWWVIVFFVPLANVVALWVFAFARWPALRAS